MMTVYKKYMNCWSFILAKTTLAKYQDFVLQASEDKRA